MKKRDDLQFRVRGIDKKLISTKNKITEVKISRMPSLMLQYLFDRIGEDVKKEEITIHLYGFDDFYKRRCIDVYLVRIKEVLKETPYFIEPDYNKLTLLKNESNKEA